MGVMEVSLLSPYVLVAHALIRGRSIFDFLPSLSWLTLLVIPFLYSKDFFPASSTEAQFFGIMTFTLALILGDKLSPLPSHSKGFFEHSSSLKTKPTLTSEMLMFLLVFSVPIVTYMLNKDIPFLKLITEGEYSLDLAENRAQYTKLGIPNYFLSILGNYIINLVGPLLILQFLTKRRFILSAIVFFWVGFYALSSSAKNPFLTFLLVILICSITRVKHKFELLLKILILSGIFLFTVSSISFANQIQNDSSECNLPVQILETPANKMRLCSKELLLNTNIARETLTYRVFLTPVEVSNNWYREFLNQNSDGALDRFLSLDSRNGTANKIGIKYYFLVFGPKFYTKDVAAYASIDADSYSYGGRLFAFIAAFIVLLIRVSICHVSFAIGKPNLNVFTVCFLALFPALASIQALLFSQGLGILVLITFLYWVKSKSSLTRGGFIKRIKS
jgi:hypothetical protein